MAETVKSIVNLDDGYAQEIMDRSKPLDDGLIGAILAQSVMSWDGKNPAPALDPDGNFQGTDLDLFSFLMPLAERGAIIEIPHYRNRRKIIHKDGERKIGSSQFGKITGLVSNSQVLSFSVRLWDMSIVQNNAQTGEESLGAHRAYMIVDCDGHWYDGWDKIVFKPNTPENAFLTEKGLLTGNTIYFKHYVHPNRWQSIFGAQHLLKLLLVERMDDEARFYRAEIKRLEAEGIFWPEETKTPYEAPSYEGAIEKIMVRTIDFEFDRPEFIGAYQPVEDSRRGLIGAYQRQKYLTYTLKPLVRFAIRANEAAYFLYGNGRVASWMDGRHWKEGWRLPKGRVDWRYMRLSPTMGLRYRLKEVTQTISAE